MKDLEDEFEPSILKNKEKKTSTETLLIFDAETENSIAIELEVENITGNQELEFFFDDNIRKIWHKQEEEWYFSISDIIEILSESTNPKEYIKKMRKRDSELNSNWGTICTPIQMVAKDGKKRKVQAANVAGVLRIIQSIPSKKAEPFKQWLAQVGKERLDEIADPELAFERMVDTYRKKGYSEKWIEQRLHAIDVRKLLTDEWKRAGIDDTRQYATLTNVLTQTWSGKSIKEYKSYKGLRKENLRDNMTNIELALNQLAEVSATAIAQAKSPKGYTETKDTVTEGGTIAGNARKELEERIGRSVISPLNAQSPALLDESDEK